MYLSTLRLIKHGDVLRCAQAEKLTTYHKPATTMDRRGPHSTAQRGAM